MLLIKLITIATGSNGNSYALVTDTEILLLDAGIKLSDVKRAINYRVSDVTGCIVTHRHKDHAGYIEEYQRNAIRCYSSDEVRADIEQVYGELTTPIHHGKAITLGGFTVQPFDLLHDVPCNGFLIKHEEIGKMLYITDTEYVKNDFSKLGINQVLVECNYSKELLDEHYEIPLRNRVLQSHMELQTTCDFIESINSRNLYNVILCHLSSENSNENLFKQEVSRRTYANVYIASKGVIINIGNSIF